MDVLLEMSPGTGWLACENGRVLYLPNAESVEVAHDVIEPLLVARSDDQAFGTLASWIESERPLPPIVLIGISSPPRVMASGLHSLHTVTPRECREGTHARPGTIDNRHVVDSRTDTPR